MKKLQSIITQLESHIPDFEKTNLTVSTSTIGWQIEHSLLVINKVVSEIKKSNPSDYKWKFNKNRFLVQTILYPFETFHPNNFPRTNDTSRYKIQPVKTFLFLH